MAKLLNTFNTQLVDKYKDALNIGKNVFYIRKSKGLSQTDLANIADTTQRIISDIEAGDYSDSIGNNLLARIANGLGVETYILNKKIDWTINELIHLILSQAYTQYGIDRIDILGIMKLLFFIDYENNYKYGEPIRNCNYIRYYAGPYDNELYKSMKDSDNAMYYNLVEKIGLDEQEYTYFTLRNDIRENYIYLDNERINHIKLILSNYLKYTSEELRSISYEIPEMKAIGATIGGKEGFGTIILN